MRNTLKVVAVATAALMAFSISTSASAFSTGPCKACHAVDHDVVGPAWKRVAKKYGSEAKLAAVFKAGFPVNERKIASTEPKFKAQVGTMTPMFNMYIKGHEDDAAKALFAAVKSGKM